ncbi:MAG: acyltransferase [Leadbetterella sp.]|nr:acyltransferase [Leadbetterella sp.]
MGSIVKRVFERIKRTLILSRYNNFTIAEYFREQGAQIGANCIIIPRELGTEPYLVKIGNHVVINKGVELHTHDGGTWIFREEIPDLRVFGPVIIEDNCLIGNGAIILPNVRIGKNSIVSAGSVVITDVPPNSIVMGVPARRFGSTEKYKEKCVERWKEQKPSEFHPDCTKNYNISPNQNIILEQLKAHLTKLFKDELH